MPVLKVHSPHGKAPRSLPFLAGSSVWETLDKAGLHLASECRGAGRCGKCLVRLVDEGGRDRGISLACRLRPDGDESIVLPEAPGRSFWHDLDNTDLPGGADSASTPENPVTPPLAAAVDLGTTNIALSLREKSSGRCLGRKAGPNPQWLFGTDVMTRLQEACDSPETAVELSRAVGSAIAEGIELLTPGGFSMIDELLIVGNTAMLALLTGRNVRRLLQPEFWSEPIDVLPAGPEEEHLFRSRLRLPAHPAIALVPEFGGFVGSDILAGIVATGLLEGPAPALLVDFGTNSEIALWDGKRLLVTSAAGGPAFEGCGIQCGMSAGPGAVFAVEAAGAPLREDADRPLPLSFRAFPGKPPGGFCGSGLVDLFAVLLRAKLMNRGGRLAEDYRKDGFDPGLATTRSRLFSQDIDAFQRAKAAIGAGIATLTRNGGLTPRDLARCCICGAFGRNLNLDNARDIGLLPEIPDDRFEIRGNTSLAGCEQLLLSGDRRKIIAGIRAKTQVMNLAQSPGYEALFVQHLYFQPFA